MSDLAIVAIGTFQLVLGVWLGWQYKTIHERRVWRRRFRQAFEQAQRTRATVVLNDDHGCCCSRTRKEEASE